MQSIIPLNLQYFPPTMAILLSWVCDNTFVLSIGATTVCTIPPIIAPAIRSLWKFVNQYDCISDFSALLPSSPSSSATISVAVD
ncbi:hypothetical protein L1987_22580 [Smallanthus sonchifolius]|uniref:Uncharacterized protein n=1 Tax=Smallanthus sonchifolius TaxID=185202 RepID=A0ACB9IHX2_9ASTR|nr:hypothetical protein L1987_22580 [Smallanthus sonchifolius]